MITEAPDARSGVSSDHGIVTVGGPAEASNHYEMALGLLAMSLLPDHPTTLDIVWRMTVCGIGFGFFNTPNNRAIITSAPPIRTGGASGMQATARLLGQSMGAALVALVFTAFPFEGTTVFESMEDDEKLIADPGDVRKAYLAELDRFIEGYRSGLNEGDVEYHLIDTATPPSQALLRFLTGAWRTRGRRK